MTTAPPIVEAHRQTRGLRFAPFPELLGRSPAPDQGWRPLVELDLDPAAEPAGFTLAAVLRAEVDHSTPGPHAVHALRTLTRELVFAMSASLYLTGSATVFDERDWLVREVGRAAASTEPALLLAGARTGTDRAAAEVLLTIITPILDGIRRATRVGRRTLSSYVVDTASFAMINLARQLGRDRVAAWSRAEEFAEALYEAGLPRLSRPELARYRGDDPAGVWAVRGACCLDFKDPGHGYCLTCPLLDAEERTRRWQATTPAVNARIRG
ncbi:(2Fe-2S)-binding protein [Microlunatus sp. GCM10028923]|uniref:(2Fe-2S)-binding protein n=1 Tax=Microlunatus sp. GCM10028923 TaxID=3273400 RepID=UPI0036075CBB